MSKQSLKVLACLSLLIFSGTPAYAYLDPGTGSIIIQAILGGIAGLAVLVKLYWKKFKYWLSISFKKDKEP